MGLFVITSPLTRLRIVGRPTLFEVREQFFDTNFDFANLGAVQKQDKSRAKSG